jgi:sugar O-acyltransferase (sialic acid O-acetyltransferase NeuD family)
MNKPIAIYGAGGFGREVLTLIEHINVQEKLWDFLGYFDDQMIDSPLYLGDATAINTFEGELQLVLATGDSCMRHAMRQKIIKKDVIFPTLIHPSVILGRREAINIGVGCVLCAGVVITLDVSLGDFSVINLNTTIGHNSNLGTFNSLMPGVNIAGDVQLADRVYVGSGANILNGRTVGAQTKIGSGAVVTKDLPANCTAVGVPAVIVKKQ